MLWKTLIWLFLLIFHLTNMRVILVQKILFATNIIQFQLHVYCIKPLVARFESIHDVTWFNYHSFFSFPNVCSNSKVSSAFPPKKCKLTSFSFSSSFFYFPFVISLLLFFFLMSSTTSLLFFFFLHPFAAHPFLFFFLLFCFSSSKPINSKSISWTLNVNTIFNKTLK